MGTSMCCVVLKPPRLQLLIPNGASQIKIASASAVMRAKKFYKVFSLEDDQIFLHLYWEGRRRAVLSQQADHTVDHINYRISRLREATCT